MFNFKVSGMNLAASMMVVVMGLMVAGCQKKAPQHDMNAMMSTGDTIMVHNKSCAESGSALKEEDLGKWTSEVAYTGTNPKFQGKKFIFNQCCDQCNKTFQERWPAQQDDILKQYGIQ